MNDWNMLCTLLTFPILHHHQNYMLIKRSYSEKAIFTLTHAALWNNSFMSLIIWFISAIQPPIRTRSTFVTMNSEIWKKKTLGHKYENLVNRGLPSAPLTVSFSNVKFQSILHKNQQVRSIADVMQVWMKYNQEIQNLINLNSRETHSYVNFWQGVTCRGRSYSYITKNFTRLWIQYADKVAISMQK